MNNLSNTVRTYFLDHFSELPLDKQLHFASRLWFWQRDEKARQLLDELRPAILPTNDVINSLHLIGRGELLPLRQGSANVIHLREPYFQRYPKLRQTTTMLYWGLILDNCYGTNARDRLPELFALSELKALHDQLIVDSKSLAILSTHAVNFLYLYKLYVLGDEQTPAPEIFTKLASSAESYDLGDLLHTQLRIYLLTHTIIGESIFYQRPLPAEKLEAYRPVIQLLETIINENISGVNLDNKLEFLVCCHLVGHKTSLEDAILDESGRSLSNDGDYLIDRHNSNPQSTYNSFDKSEHRSLLFILATSQRDNK